MSDTFLRLVPTDPFHLPTEKQRADALDAARAKVIGAWSCEWVIYPAVQFIDCGENLEEIICPSCSVHLKIDYFTENDPVMSWWNTVFNNVGLLEAENCLDVRGSDTVQMPCCSLTVRVLDLRFDWPAAFARCELSIMNPDVPSGPQEEEFSEVEACLGCDIQQIWAHY